MWANFNIFVIILGEIGVKKIFSGGKCTPPHCHWTRVCWMKPYDGDDEIYIFAKLECITFFTKSKEFFLFFFFFFFFFFLMRKKLISLERTRNSHNQDVLVSNLQINEPNEM